VPAAALGAALLVPSGASAASTLHGTVVKRSSKAFVVANPAGRLSLVHANRTPRTRHSVTVRVSRLADGSYRATRVRTGGVRRTARIRGTVGFRSRRSFAVVAGGAQLSVRTQKRVSARTGSRVVVRVTIDPSGDLTSDDTTPTTTGAAGFSIEGTLTAIDATAGTLTITDPDGTGTLTVSVPSTIDISALTLGEDISISVAQGDAGLVLVTIDDTANAGDDEGDDSGPGDRGEHGDDGDHGDDGGHHAHGHGDDGDDGDDGDSSGSGSSGSGGGEG